MTPELHRQSVWPTVLRLIHWILALCILVLLVTGWLLGSGLVLNDALYDLLRQRFHVPAGQIAGAALVGRVVLLVVDPGVAGWRALVRRPADPGSRGEMLRFYLSWGRRRPPAYFSHDPVWALVYPAFFLLLGLQVSNGLAIHYQGLRQLSGLGLEDLSQWHGRFGLWLAWFAGLHVASVLLREVRGKGCEVSAMLHGHRIFTRDDPGSPGGGNPVNIPVDRILDSRRNKDR